MVRAGKGRNVEPIQPGSEAGSAPSNARSHDIQSHRWAGARRWIPRLYLGFAAVLVPWSAYLAVSLPQRSLSLHYRGTWVGFNLALIVVLARIGWLAYRRDARVVVTAAVGSTLLLTDAWFDVTTAATGAAHTQALLSAIFLEIPTAVLSGLLARRGINVLVERARVSAPEPETTPEPPAGRVRNHGDR